MLEVQTNEAELTLIARYQFFGGNLPHSLLRLYGKNEDVTTSLLTLRARLISSILGVLLSHLLPNILQATTPNHLLTQPSILLSPSISYH